MPPAKYQSTGEIGTSAGRGWLGCGLGKLGGLNNYGGVMVVVVVVVGRGWLWLVVVVVVVVNQCLRAAPTPKTHKALGSRV